MAKTVAAACALLAFAVCLIVGIDAGNTFATTILRGLKAMGGTFAVAFVVGRMAEAMVAEAAKKPQAEVTEEKIGPTKNQGAGR